MPLLACIISIAILYAIALLIAPRLGLMRENFQGKRIPASYGILAFLQILLVTVGLTLAGKSQWDLVGIWLGTMGAMWALGVLDDVFGSREVGGFKGHFRKLLVERKLTTGAVKAIGGGIVGIIAGWFVSGGEPIRWVAAALVIPLCANLLNLVDLRPGRAVAVFFLGIGVTYSWAATSLPSWIIGPVVGVALLWGFSDSRGRAMMGDSGSNSFGAALGLAIALGTGVIAQFIVIAAIIAVHLYSEKHSISALIERHPVLRAIDRRLGVR